MRPRIPWYTPAVLTEIEKWMKLLMADPQKNRNYIEQNIQKIQTEIDIITLQVRCTKFRREKLHLQAMWVELMAFRNRLLWVLSKIS